MEEERSRGEGESRRGGAGEQESRMGGQEDRTRSLEE